MGRSPKRMSKTIFRVQNPSEAVCILPQQVVPDTPSPEYYSSVTTATRVVYGRRLTGIGAGTPDANANEYWILM
jgi:hypothetical protein